MPNTRLPKLGLFEMFSRIIETSGAGFLLSKKQTARRQDGKTARIRALVLCASLSLFSLSYFPLSPSANAMAGVNNFINVQGKVTNSDGTNVGDGAYDFVFKLYDGAGSGASATFTESWVSGSLFSSTMSSAPSSGGESLTYSSNANESSLKAGQYLWNTTKQEAVKVVSVNTTTNVITISPTHQAWNTGDTVTNKIYVRDGIFQVALNSLNADSNWGTTDFSQSDIFLGINYNSDGEMKPRSQFSSVPYAFQAKHAQSVDGLSIVGGKTLTINNSITFSGSDGTAFTLPGSSGSLATSDVTTGQIAFGNNTNDLKGDADLWWDNLNKRLGVGTNTPGAVLDVDGTAQISGALTFSNYTTNGGILYTGSGGTVGQTTAGTLGQCLQSAGSGSPTWGACAAADTVTGSGVAGQMAFFTDTNELASDGNLVWDNSNKWFGIGGTPSSALSVYGYGMDAYTGTADVRISSVAGGGAGIQFSPGGTGVKDWSIFASSENAGVGAGQLAFWNITDAQYGMVLSADGRLGLNLGLSSSTARAQLQIGRAAAPTGLTVADSYLHLGNEESANDSYRLITFGYSSDSYDYAPAYLGYKTTDTTDGEKGALVFGTRNSTDDEAPLERMRIAEDGKVGIGTSTPGRELEVVGDIISTGTKWTSRTVAASNKWVSVAYGNGLFVAIANNGTGNRVMTSPDGVNWTSQVSAADNSWSSVTYGNGLFVAVASSGTGNRVMTSPDGVNWTSQVSAADNSWSSVTYGNGLFVAVEFAGMKEVMTSPDGVNWTIREAASANLWRSVTYGNGLFVAVGGKLLSDNVVMTSPDGINWTSQTAEVRPWEAVTYGNGLFVAITRTVSDNKVMTSPDGVTWTIRDIPASSNQWQDITYGNGLFVAVNGYGLANHVMTSPDGINWTSRSGISDDNWFGITYGNGMFVAVGDNQAMTSGFIDHNTLSTNNLYQGGMKVNGGLTLGQYSSRALLYTDSTGKLTQDSSFIWDDVVKQLLIGGSAIIGNSSIGTADLSLGKSSSDALLRIGQDSTHNLGIKWSYSATAGDAVAIIETYNGTNALALQPNGGKVGIGTSTPDAILTVQSADDTTSTTGSNSVVNGTFTGSLAGWTGSGWTYGSNMAVASLGGAQLYQSVTLTAGKQYRMEYTIPGYSSGAVTAFAQGTYVVTDTPRNSVGTFTFDFRATSGSMYVGFLGSTYSGYIDDVSVYEVVPVDALIVANSSDGTSALEIRPGGSGSDSTFIGLNVGRYNVSGTNNTGLGVNALSSISNGHFNTALGANSLGSLVQGWYNTAVGDSALSLNGTEYNTALGSSALKNNTSGQGNTAIGYGAGLNNVTGSGNVFIGSQAGASETTSGKLYIDNSNTSSPLIYGDFSTNALTFNGSATVTSSLTTNGTASFTGNVGIGTTAGSNPLVISKSGVNFSIQAGTLNGVANANAYTLDIGGSNMEMGIWDNLTVSGRTTAGGLTVGGTATTYKLEVADYQDDYIMRVNNTRNGWYASGILIDINVPNTSRRVTNRFISFAGSGTIDGKISAGAGGGVVYSTSGADFAEYFLAKDPSNLPQSGELVSVAAGYNQTVERTVTAKDKRLIGVVSTNPAFLGNGPICSTQDINCDANYGRTNVIVALSGQVPVKVSTENGAIKAGDLITSSSTPGVAMKANAGDTTIGTALQSYAGSTVGSIKVLVNLEHHTALLSEDNLSDAQLTSMTQIDPTTVQTINLKVTGALTVGGPAEFKGPAIFRLVAEFFDNVIFHSDVIFEGRPTFNKDTAGFATIHAGQQEVTITFDKEYADTPVTNATAVTPQLTDEQFQSKVADEECLLEDGKDVCQQKLDDDYLGDAINFIITKKSTTGFTIRLSAIADKDLTFNWTALAVKDAQNFEITPTPTLLP